MIVADAGPVVAFSLIGRTELIRKLVGRAAVSPATAERAKNILRVMSPETEFPGEETVVVKFVDVTAPTLSLAESETLQLARQEKAPLLLTDDAVVRREARSLRLAVLGTVGLLEAARKRGLIEDVGALASELQQAGYTLSERSLALPEAQ